MRSLSPFALALLSAGCLRAGSAGSGGSSAPSGTPKVGPPNGTVIVVGGGGMGPEIYSKFIEAAGGPNALIVDVPTAGGDSVYPADWRGANGWKANGAKNVVVLHSNKDAKGKVLANSDSFVNILNRAGGVWFEGGRQWHIYASYAGTRTEKAFNDVLARGGVIGGSSAGASILGSLMIRGAPSNNNFIMLHPEWLSGLGYLRNTGIDQHVVARQRLPDLADSVMKRYPNTLLISEDEGTAWVVKGDRAEIVGRNKAFVYNGREATDPGKPFLTLFPGDKFDMASRRVIRRALDDTPLTQAFVDSLFAPFANPALGGAAVHVAQEGRVLLAKSYGIPAQARYLPTTGVPNFPLGGLSDGFRATEALFLADSGKLNVDEQVPGADGATLRDLLSQRRPGPSAQKLISEFYTKRAGMTDSVMLQRRIFGAIGRQRTALGADGQILSNVDELYRWELGLAQVPAFTRREKVSVFTTADGKAIGAGLGWTLDTYRGLPRQRESGIGDGRKHAFVRIPGHKVSIIILTNSDTTNVQAIADRITDRLLFPPAAAAGRFQSQAVPSTSSCRSMSAVSAQVAWAGCTRGAVFRTVDAGRTWEVDSVPGASRLDFRGIKAFDANTAVVTSAGPAEQGQARIYRTVDGGKSWTLAWSDTSKGIFLDGLAFWDAKHGFTFSDPVDGRLVVLTTDDGGASWAKVPSAGIPPVLAGEAAFAASNTQLAVQGSSAAWIASGGGAEARVFRTTDRGRTWTVSSTGMPGGPSAGLFGIAFADSLNGLAVGGDYRIERGVTDFALRTRDGGATWQLAGMRRPDGTTQGLALVPGTNPPVFAAVGARGVALTLDFGASWSVVDTVTAWGVSFASPAAGWVAGRAGRVAALSGSVSAR